MMCVSKLLLLAATGAGTILLAIPAHSQNCGQLTALHAAGMAVTQGRLVESGKFSGKPADATKYAALPAFCEVVATLRPTSDSEIGIEVWLPEAAAWNGKFEGTGNGGWGGSINYADMAHAVARGYAATSTDTGHTGGSAAFAVGHPEKLIDFGYRAIHEMTVATKVIVSAYYGRPQRLAYFAGCSSGGRQAMMEAQRYPEDYDGIIAGAPTYDWTNMMFGRIWVAQATLAETASYIPRSQYPLIHDAALAACDAKDGVKDRLISDPLTCHFDPAVLACKQGESGAPCLTSAQVQAAKRIYTPTTNPVTRAEIYPPMERGSELAWGTLAGGPVPITLATEYFKYVVFNDPKWDFKTLNFSSDLAKAQQIDHGTLTASNPDLRPFFARGGKLIHYHGWTDWQVMPESSIQYFERVHATSGKATSDGYRLFLAPGMGHCGGGDGPNTFDMLTALEQWKEHGKAPDAIPAAHKDAEGKVDRSRPLCAWPEQARYKGTGSTDEAANFSCVKPVLP